MYRQQTLAALAGGGSAEALQLAYSDIEEAWLEYLRRHNDGRGFVLLGHSQGTRMLRQLLRKVIDPDATVRRRLISGVLLGGNVTVRKGSTAGGDFQNVPACTREAQTGCVFAWSTFNETPPSNSRYGRVPAKDDSGLGFPAGDGFQIACPNPAAANSVSAARARRVGSSTHRRKSRWSPPLSSERMPRPTNCCTTSPAVGLSVIRSDGPVTLTT